MAGWLADIVLSFTLALHPLFCILSQYESDLGSCRAFYIPCLLVAKLEKKQVCIVELS